MTLSRDARSVEVRSDQARAVTELKRSDVELVSPIPLERAHRDVEVSSKHTNRCFLDIQIAGCARDRTRFLCSALFCLSYSCQGAVAEFIFIFVCTSAISLLDVWYQGKTKFRLESFSNSYDLVSLFLHIVANRVF